MLTRRQRSTSFFRVNSKFLTTFFEFLNGADLNQLLEAAFHVVIILKAFDGLPFTFAARKAEVKAVGPADQGHTVQEQGSRFRNYFAADEGRRFAVLAVHHMDAQIFKSRHGCSLQRMFCPRLNFPECWDREGRRQIPTETGLLPARLSLLPYRFMPCFSSPSKPFQKTSRASIEPPVKPATTAGASAAS